MQHLKLYLDDVRPCPDGWRLARSFDEAVGILTNHHGTFDVSLDHDLGNDDYDGTSLVKWFISAGRFPDDAQIHSANPVGRKNLTFDLAHMRRYQDAQEDE